MRRFAWDMADSPIMEIEPFAARELVCQECRPDIHMMDQGYNVHLANPNAIFRANPPADLKSATLAGFLKLVITLHIADAWKVKEFPMERKI